MTASTGTPPHRSRNNRRRAGYPETGPSGSEGGRTEKDQPKPLAPRRSADPTQTLKKWLTRQKPATTIRGLQVQLDRFAAYYNTRRPHRAIGRRTPVQAYTARIKATPQGPRLELPAHCRVRHDTIDNGGSVTLRYRSKLYHIGVGRRHTGTKVVILVKDLDVRILTQDGTLLRQLTLDPARNYQPTRLPASP
jgi:hypothetical protein